MNDAQGPMSTVKHRAPTLSILAFIIAWLALAYALVRTLAIAWIPLFLGGAVLWWLTTRARPIDPHRFIVPYLLTVIAFVVHVYEEYAAFQSGHHHILEGLPFVVTTQMLITHAAFLAPILWLVGLVMTLHRWQVGYFVASTFLFGMMFIEILHFIASFVQSGRFYYVGGLYTAILPIVFSWWTFLLIWRETRNATPR